MPINPDTFFSYARRAPFGGRLTQAQVDGCKALLRAFEGMSPRWQAYALATAFHETAGTMKPLREYGGPSYWKRYEGREDLGNVNPGDGVKFHGRGFVQLTGRDNYRKASKLLGADLINKPDLTMRPDYAAVIMRDGMIKGWFTGQKLADYFNAEFTDPVGARRIINGRDKARLIAGYYRNFLDALDHARSPRAPQDVKEEDAQPDDIPAARSGGLWGLVTSFLSGIGGLAWLGTINNPWAFGAFGLLLVAGGVGAWLLLSGRIEIKRKAA